MALMVMNEGKHKGASVFKHEKEGKGSNGRTDVYNK